MIQSHDDDIDTHTYTQTLHNIICQRIYISVYITKKKLHGIDVYYNKTTIICAKLEENNLDFFSLHTLVVCSFQT
jgi:hypothetical protein